MKSFGKNTINFQTAFFPILPSECEALALLLMGDLLLKIKPVCGQIIQILSGEWGKILSIEELHKKTTDFQITFFPILPSECEAIALLLMGDLLLTAKNPIRRIPLLLSGELEKIASIEELRKKYN
ncbi:MAG: hypothetical protein PVF83_06840 [Anaerolineales bacterium]